MKKIIFSLALVAMLLPSMSLAANWQFAENISITRTDSVSGNAYLAGSNITVSGPVTGDLFAAGRTVSISGAVSGDIMAAGGVVNISGASAEDARLAGTSVTISGDFSGELLAAGSMVSVSSDAVIEGDVRIMGENISFNGISSGDVHFFGQKMVIGPDAVIEGDFNYSSPDEAQIDPGAVISGDINFSKASAGHAREEGARGVLAGFLSLIFLGKFLAVLLAAYLLWYLRKKEATDVIQGSIAKFGQSLFRGFVFLVVLPAAAIILSFTLIGVPIAIFSLLIYAALLMLACPFAVLFASSLIAKKKTDLRWYHILLGALVLAVLDVLPMIGWVIGFLLYIAALGSMLAVLKLKFKR